MASRRIEVELIGNSASLQRALGQSEAGLARLGSKMTSFGHSATTHLTVPIGLAAAASVKFAADFQHSMELVHTQAGASQREVEKMSKAILDLAPAVATGPNELAQALYHIESVGVRGAAAMDVLKNAALGAKVGGADLESTVNALTAAQVNNLKGTTSMQQAMGELNAIVGVGNTRMDDLAASMSSGVLTSAKTFGLSLQSVGAALATLTDAGTPAQEAATRLRMTFSLLGAPTSKAATELKTIGLSASDLANAMRKPDGLVGAVTMLHDHLDGLTKTQQAALLSGAFGGGRSSATIMALVNNLGRLQTKYDAIGKGVSKYGDAVKKTTETDQFKFQQGLAQLEVTGIKVGDALLPVFVTLAGDVQKAAAAFDGLSPGTQKFAIEAAIALAVVGPLSTGLGNIAKGANVAYQGMRLLTGAEIAAGSASTAAGGAFLIMGAALAGGIIFANHLSESGNALGTAFDKATGSANALKDAVNALDSAEKASTQAHFAHRQAVLDVATAQKQVNLLDRQGQKGTLAYKQAVLNLQEAEQRRKDTAQGVTDAQRKQNHELGKAQDAVKGLRHEFGQAVKSSDQLQGTADRVGKSLHTGADRANEFAANMATVQADAEKAAAGLKQTDAAASRAAGKLAHAADVAQALAASLGAIPSRKDISIFIHTSRIDAARGEGTNKYQPPGSNAAGTDFWKGGVTWVGESGKELAFLPRGTRIVPHEQSMRMIASAAQPAAQTQAARPVVFGSGQGRGHYMTVFVPESEFSKIGRRQAAERGRLV